MSDRLLVRNVPVEVQHWIKLQRQQQQMTQQEFLLSMLHQASAAQQSPLLPFESSTSRLRKNSDSDGFWEGHEFTRAVSC